MPHVIDSPRPASGVHFAPRALRFGVQERTGLGAYDPSAEDSVNAAAGYSDGNYWGRGRGTADATAGRAMNPPMSIGSNPAGATGSGAYDGAWVSGAHAGYVDAYNAAKGAPTVYTPPAPPAWVPPPPGVIPVSVKPGTPAAMPPEDNTLLYVGAGVAVVAVLGGVIYFATRKRRARPNPRRRAHRRGGRHGR